MTLANDTDALLDEIVRYLRRFVVVTDHQAAAIALWVLHTYVYHASDTTPYLVITSAEKGCGKTRLFEVLDSIIHNPVMATALTEAVLFRAIATLSPTLLIDETDAIFKEHRAGPSERQEGLRAILNAGYRRGITIMRSAPNGQDILRFAVFAPKALAGIGHMPETIEHRGLPIRLVRRLDTEAIERFRFRLGEEEGGKIRTRCEQWEPGARIALSGTYPDMPEELDDRAQDAYEQLVAIADLAGRGWSTRGRTALVALRIETTMAPKESTGVLMLRDLDTIPWGDAEWMPTADLLTLLFEHGDSPWSEWWQTEATSKKAARRLAMILAEYGIQPHQKWLNGANVKSYRIAALKDAISRYRTQHDRTLESEETSQNSTDEHSRSGEAPSELRNGAKPHGSAETSDLASSPPLPEIGTVEWLGQASLEDLEKWEREQLDTD